MVYPAHKISVAPMMDWTDRYCRYFMRQISQYPLLYTEMITTKAILHGDREHLLRFDQCEHPLALQLGGSDAIELRDCAKIGEDFGYDEINLNVGCPSDRVQAGAFGLCLMKTPLLVAECVAAMKKVVAVPVTVKTRIGYDNVDDYTALTAFVRQLVEAGVDGLTVHARKGWLKGLSPKENRSIPPLNYEYVYQLKRDFPMLAIGINGGIHTLDEITRHLAHVDSVMLGRSAYHDPYLLAAIGQRFYEADADVTTRADVIHAIVAYLAQHSALPLKKIFRHMPGLYHGTAGARAWRQMLSSKDLSLVKVLAFIEQYAEVKPEGQVASQF